MWRYASLIARPDSSLTYTIRNQSGERQDQAAYKKTKLLAMDFKVGQFHLLQIPVDSMRNIGGMGKYTTHRIEQVEVNGARCHTRRQARAQAVQVTEVELPLHLSESRLTYKKLGGDRWILRCQRCKSLLQCCGHLAVIRDEIIPSFVRKCKLTAPLPAGQAHDLFIDNITNLFQIRDGVEERNLTMCLLLGHPILVKLRQVALNRRFQIVKLVIECVNAGRDRCATILKGMDAETQHLGHNVGHAQNFTRGLTECDGWHRERFGVEVAWASCNTCGTIRDEC